MPSDSPTPDELMKVVDNHVAQLMEHFDSVQVFCTKQADEGKTTATVQTGDGNWYARYGQVREWVNQEEARARMQVRRND